MNHIARLTILIAGLLAFLLSPAFAAKRVALVIGNSAYQNVQHLPNPVHDAEDMAVMLNSLGFKVTKATNLDRIAMEEALSAFSNTAVGADIALVFYAGHGMEVGRRNFLIPVDAKLGTDRRVPFETISLNHVLAALDGVRGVRIVLLDACRNNPFATSMKVTSASRSVGRGLARVEAPRSTLISFSAKEGTIAADGHGRNSPYTSALLDILNQPGLEIGLLFREVRDRVLAATDNHQEPFVSASLSSRAIYLVPPPRSAAPLPRAKPDLAGAVWEVTKDTDSTRVLKAFIKRFKGTVYADLAGARLKELSDAAAKAKPPKKASRTTSTTRTNTSGLKSACRGRSISACQKLCSMGRKRACLKLSCLRGNRSACSTLRATR